jgi:hypothetical protein
MMIGTLEKIERNFLNEFIFVLKNLDDMIVSFDKCRFSIYVPSKKKFEIKFLIPTKRLVPLKNSIFPPHYFTLRNQIKFELKTKSNIHSHYILVYSSNQTRSNQTQTLIFSSNSSILIPIQTKWLLLTLTLARSISLWVPCSPAKPPPFFVVSSPMLITAGTHR